MRHHNLTITMLTGFDEEIAAGGMRCGAQESVFIVSRIPHGPCVFCVQGVLSLYNAFLSPGPPRRPVHRSALIKALSKGGLLMSSHHLRWYLAASWMMVLWKAPAPTITEVLHATEERR